MSTAGNTKNAPPCVAFTAKLLVKDASSLIEEFALDCQRIVPASVALLHYSTLTREKPDQNGFRITSRKLNKISNDEYQLTVEAAIFDPDAFKKAALDAVFENFGDTKTFLDAPQSMLLAELVLCSNAAQSPDQLGYAISEVSDAMPTYPQEVACSGMEP